VAERPGRAVPGHADHERLRSGREGPIRQGEADRHVHVRFRRTPAGRHEDLYLQRQRQHDRLARRDSPQRREPGVDPGDVLRPGPPHPRSLRGRCPRRSCARDAAHPRLLRLQRPPDAF